VVQILGIRSNTEACNTLRSLCKLIYGLVGSIYAQLQIALLNQPPRLCEIASDEDGDCVIFDENQRKSTGGLTVIWFSSTVLATVYQHRSYLYYWS
jgi:hypothetical protein